MRPNILHWLFLGLLSGCGSGEAEQKNESSTNEVQIAATSGVETGDGIVGEWLKEMACFDKNGNAQLEFDEKIPANSGLGFDYFRFNSDGSCLRDKDSKFKGSWEIKETGSKKTLFIHAAGGGETIKYTIKGVTTYELVLYSSGVFLVFKRI